MTYPFLPLLRPVLAFSIGLMIFTFTSCGGGVVGSGGTGRNETGQAVGTVNGLGSVIVDGVTYEALGAAVIREVAPSIDAPSDIKLGQRVSVAYEMLGVAKIVRIETTLSGTVVSASPSGLTALGQTVTFNTGNGSGPLTQFGGGYAQASEIKAGDVVEVHGILVQAAPFYVIQATRVEKLAALPTYLRITGLVSSLSTNGTGPAFNLAGLRVDATAAVVQPPGSPPTNGQAVVVLAPAATLTTSPMPMLRAAQVRVVKLENGGLDDDVSGAVSTLDTQAKTFLLGSLLVNYATASVTPSMSMLANRQYVKVHGTISDNGTLVATSVALRDGDSGNQSTLRGNISGFDPVLHRLQVRDVSVDVSGATILGCPPSGLANGLFIQIDGSLSANGVIARAVQCEAESSGSTVEREGVATTVDAGMQTFTLVPERGAVIIVQWSSTTFFSDVTPQTLGGKQVEVEGSVANGALRATKIKLSD